jgi:hypothetical protein
VPLSLTVLAGLGLSSNVFAGGSSVGSIVYGSGGSAVPTLGGSALIVLAILLAVIAFRIMRTQQHKGVNLVVALTAITAIASGVGGVHLVSEANAAPGGVVVDLSSAGGGTVQVFLGLNYVVNRTNVPLQILDITIAPGCAIGPGADTANGGASVGECGDNPSTTVPPEGFFCTLIVTCDG